MIDLGIWAGGCLVGIFTGQADEQGRGSAKLSTFLPIPVMMD